MFLSASKTHKIARKACALIMSVMLCLEPAIVSAQVLPVGVSLPQPGVMVGPSPEFNPVQLRGLKLYPNEPFRFDFFIDHGDEVIEGEELKAQSTKLIKYFLAGLTIPKENLWVNLSPYEEDHIVEEAFGQTEMGRDLLAQDYMLKQITASLIYPEDELGKQFWSRVYEEAYERFGTTAIPINTFNKVWIVPEEAEIFEQDDIALVVNTRLKVMMEEDYLSLEQNRDNEKIGTDKLAEGEVDEVSTLSSDIVREIVIPAIEQEVNEGKNFAQLRQVYQSLVLATWYKVALKESILNQKYSNQSKVNGVDIEDKEAKLKIYNRYLEAFKKGVYDYIKEEYQESEDVYVKRQYFSGGAEFSATEQSLKRVRGNPQALSARGVNVFGSVGNRIVNQDGNTNLGLSRVAVRAEHPRPKATSGNIGNEATVDRTRLTEQGVEIDLTEVRGDNQAPGRFRHTLRFHSDFPEPRLAEDISFDTEGLEDFRYGIYDMIDGERFSIENDNDGYTDASNAIEHILEGLPGDAQVVYYNSQVVGDIFGFARPQDNLIGVYHGFSQPSQAVAVFHEIAEYLLDIGYLTMNVDESNVLHLRVRTQDRGEMSSYTFQLNEEQVKLFNGEGRSGLSRKRHYEVMALGLLFFKQHHHNFSKEIKEKIAGERISIEKGEQLPAVTLAPESSRAEEIKQLRRYIDHVLEYGEMEKKHLENLLIGMFKAQGLSDLDAFSRAIAIIDKRAVISDEQATGVLNNLSGLEEWLVVDAKQEQNRNDFLSYLRAAVALAEAQPVAPATSSLRDAQRAALARLLAEALKIRGQNPTWLVFFNSFAIWLGEQNLHSEPYYEYGDGLLNKGVLPEAVLDAIIDNQDRLDEGLGQLGEMASMVDVGDLRSEFLQRIRTVIAEAEASHAASAELQAELVDEQMDVLRRLLRGYVRGDAAGEQSLLMDMMRVVVNFVENKMTKENELSDADIKERYLESDGITPKPELLRAFIERRNSGEVNPRIQKLVDWADGRLTDRELAWRREKLNEDVPVEQLPRPSRDAQRVALESFVDSLGGFGGKQQRLDALLYISLLVRDMGAQGLFTSNADAVREDLGTGVYSLPDDVKDALIDHSHQLSQWLNSSTHFIAGQYTDRVPVFLKNLERIINEAAKPRTTEELENELMDLQAKTLSQMVVTQRAHFEGQAKRQFFIIWAAAEGKEKYSEKEAEAAFNAQMSAHPSVFEATCKKFIAHWRGGTLSQSALDEFRKEAPHVIRRVAMVEVEFRTKQMNRGVAIKSLSEVGREAQRAGLRRFMARALTPAGVGKEFSAEMQKNLNVFVAMLRGLKKRGYYQGDVAADEKVGLREDDGNVPSRILDVFIDHANQLETMLLEGNTGEVGIGPKASTGKFVEAMRTVIEEVIEIDPAQLPGAPGAPSDPSDPNRGPFNRPRASTLPPFGYDNQGLAITSEEYTKVKEWYYRQQLDENTYLIHMTDEQYLGITIDEATAKELGMKLPQAQNALNLVKVVHWLNGEKDNDNNKGNTIRKRFEGGGDIVVTRAFVEETMKMSYEFFTINILPNIRGIVYETTGFKHLKDYFVGNDIAVKIDDQAVAFRRSPGGSESNIFDNSETKGTTYRAILTVNGRIGGPSIPISGIEELKAAGGGPPLTALKSEILDGGETSTGTEEFASIHQMVKPFASVVSINLEKWEDVSEEELAVVKEFYDAIPDSHTAKIIGDMDPTEAAERNIDHEKANKILRALRLIHYIQNEMSDVSVSLTWAHADNIFKEDFAEFNEIFPYINGAVFVSKEDGVEIVLVGGAQTAGQPSAPQGLSYNWQRLEDMPDIDKIAQKIRERRDWKKTKVASGEEYKIELDPAVFSTLKVSNTVGSEIMKALNFLDWLEHQFTTHSDPNYIAVITNEEAMQIFGFSTDYIRNVLLGNGQLESVFFSYKFGVLRLKRIGQATASPTASGTESNQAASVRLGVDYAGLEVSLTDFTAIERFFEESVDDEAKFQISLTDSEASQLEVGSTVNQVNAALRVLRVRHWLQQQLDDRQEAHASLSHLQSLFNLMDMEIFTALDHIINVDYRRYGDALEIWWTDSGDGTDNNDGTDGSPTDVDGPIGSGLKTDSPSGNGGGRLKGNGGSSDVTNRSDQTRSPRFRGQQNEGGIDFEDINVTRSGRRINFVIDHTDPNLEIEGLEPNILNVVPATVNHIPFFRTLSF